MRKYATREGPRGRSGRRFWTPAELEVLRAEFPHKVTYDLAAQLGRSYATVHAKARELGLHKSADFFKTLGGRIQPGDEDPRGKATRFQKGQKAWNAGLKGWKAGGNSPRTRFKKGHVSANTQEVGALRINADGYLDIKVAPGIRQWVALHRWNWKRRFGSFPADDMALVFKDGDRFNCEVENLELVSRADLMRRNSFHNYGPEIVSAIQLRGALMRKINNLERKAA